MKKSNLIPMVATFFRMVRSGVEYHNTLSDLNPQMRHTAVQVFLRDQIKDWNPEIQGVSVINPEARDDLASFAAHISLALGQVASQGAA